MNPKPAMSATRFVGTTLYESSPPPLPSGEPPLVENAPTPKPLTPTSCLPSMP